MMTSLTTYGRLQNATKYCTKVRKTGSAGKESNNSAIVQPKSPDFTQTPYADLVYMTADMTSPATSDRHLMKLKTAENTALVRVAQRFACPNCLVGFLA